MANNTRPYVTCPKCGNAELNIIETSEAYEMWAQDENGAISDNGDGALLGKVLRVEAECLSEGCPARTGENNFRWTLRKINDVTELPNWDSGEENEQPETNEEEATTDEEEVAETEEEPEAEEEAEEEVEPPTKTEKKKKEKGKNKSAKGKSKKEKAGGKNKGKKAA